MIWICVGIIVGLIAVLAVSLLCSKLSIVVRYKAGKVLVVLKTFFFRITLDEKFLRRFLKEKEGKTATSVQQDEKNSVDGFFAKIEKLKVQYKEVKELVDTVMKYAGSRVEISDVALRLSFGTGEAATTGMAYGAIWILAGNLYNFLCRFVNLKFPSINLYPDYNKKIFEIEGEGIIKIRPVHIIGCIIRVAKIKAAKK